MTSAGGCGASRIAEKMIEREVAGLISERTIKICNEDHIGIQWNAYGPCAGARGEHAFAGEHDIPCFEYWDIDSLEYWVRSWRSPL